MIKKSGVLVDFNYKSDGFIPTNELSQSIQLELEEGLEINAMIQKLETKEGYSYCQSQKRELNLFGTNYLIL